MTEIEWQEWARKDAYRSAELWYWSQDCRRNRHDVAQVISRECRHLMSRSAWIDAFRSYMGTPRG